MTKLRFLEYGLRPESTMEDTFRERPYLRRLFTRYIHPVLSHIAVYNYDDDATRCNEYMFGLSQIIKKKERK